MRHHMGPVELATALAVSLVLLLLTLFLFPVVTVDGDSGICLPSPNEWGLPHFWGWLIGTVLIYLSTFIITIANKRYVFVNTSAPFIGILLPLLLACNCLTSSTLTTSTLLLLCNVAILYIIFDTYESRNSTREFFIIATFLSIGSMFQYAFLLMVPVYMVGGLLMKSFRFREAIAFIFGLVAPYWIAVGFGWVPLDHLHLPGELSPVSGDALHDDLFITIIATAVTALIAFFLSLYNGVTLFSRNAQLRCIHLVINVLGFVSLIAIIFDFSNFTAYLSTLTLWLTLEVATFLTLYSIRGPRLWLTVIFLLFLSSFILLLLNF